MCDEGYQLAADGRSCDGRLTLSVFAYLLLFADSTAQTFFSLPVFQCKPRIVSFRFVRHIKIQSVHDFIVRYIIQYNTIQYNTIVV